MYFFKIGDELINLGLVRNLKREGSIIYFKFSNKEYYKYACKTDSSAISAMKEIANVIQIAQGE